VSTWFNLASARDIIYIYIRVRVCVCVCVCACACVCMWQFLRNQNDKYVFPDDPIKHATRWVWVVLRTELGGFCLNKKKVLYLKKISDVSHIRRIHTVGQHMVNTCLKPIIRWTKSFFQPYFAPKTAVNPLFLRTKTLNVVGLVTLVPLC